MSGVNLTGFTICFTLEKPVQFTPLVSFKCARHWKQIRIIHAIFCLEFASCHIKNVESSPTRTLSGLSPSCYLFRMQIKGCLRLNCGLEMKAVNEPAIGATGIF